MDIGERSLKKIKIYIKIKKNKKLKTKRMTPNENNNTNEEQNNILWPPAENEAQTNLFSNDQEEVKEPARNASPSDAGREVDSVTAKEKVVLEGVNHEAMKEVIQDSGFGLFDNNTSEQVTEPEPESEPELEPEPEPVNEVNQNEDTNISEPSLFFNDVNQEDVIEEKIQEAVEEKPSDDVVEISKSKIELIKQLVSNINESSQRINELLNNQIAEEDLGSYLTSIIKDVKGFKSKAIAFLPALTASKALIALPENGSKYIPFSEV